MAKLKFDAVLLISAVLSNVFPEYLCGSCSTSKDVAYDGNVLDCSQAGLTSDDVKNLIFTNITTLILNENNIGTLQSNSLIHFIELKHLECVSCGLVVLEVDALKGLHGLETLLLSNNHLAIIDRAFPFGFFLHVPQLKTLHIENNGNHGEASSYSEFIDIFDSLPELKSLKIDSFSTLIIGFEFSSLLNLNSLEIICYALVTMTNHSLRGFENSTVKHFALLNGVGYYDNQKCENLFQHLPNVSSLRIVDMPFGNHVVMKMMAPLQQKSIGLMHFENVGYYASVTRSEEERLHDRELNTEMLQYLSDVCVSHFVWLYSYAISFDVQTLTSRKWRHCLKSLTLAIGRTGLITNNLFMFQLARLRIVESITYKINVEDVTFDFWKTYSKQNTLAGENKIIRIATGKHPLTLKDVPSRVSTEMKLTKNLPVSNRNTNRTKTQPKLNSRDTKERDEGLSGFGSYILNLTIPKFLKKVVDLLNNMHSISSAITKIMNNGLKSLTSRYSETGCSLDFQAKGFDCLQTLDLTGSHIKSGSPIFFNQFPKLKKLLLSDTAQFGMFYLKVAESVPNLEYFDIADNGLESLPGKMFHSNRHLRYLCLASNRFGRIPFDLKLTPNLEILDLRENSMTMPRKELQSIDDHLHYVTNFTLLLSHNQISCACAGLPFLQWLQHTTVSLDRGRNYTCTAEDGTMSHTASFSDIKSLMKKCYGPSYFLVSLILLSSLIAAYMATFLGMKHKTQILAKVRQLVVPGFRLKTREDFNLDVVIGYADQDGDYVRDVLLRYLEGTWHLRTFVHQIDLLQDPLLMSQAIRDSWRTLLLITENFLDNHYMSHNVMKVCSFFVHPSNPRSVIVMVEERVQHRIPDHVLQVVDEDNIIVLPELEG